MSMYTAVGYTTREEHLEKLCCVSCMIAATENIFPACCRSAAADPCA